MARVTENGISGMVGNLIFYSVNGKNYVRTRPKARKKKRGEKANPLNTIFGTVSRHGSRMLKMVREEFGFPIKRDVYNLSRGWMRNLYALHKDDATWPFSVRTSGMCQLNPGTDLRDYFKADITVSDSGKGKITVSFPEINPKNDIKAPIRTMKVNIKLIAVVSDFETGVHPCRACTEQYSFILDNSPVPAKSFVLQTKAGAGDIGLVMVAMQYETSDVPAGTFNKELRWMPAAIVAMGRLRA